jgi:hypothetical protein
MSTMTNEARRAWREGLSSRRVARGKSFVITVDGGPARSTAVENASATERGSATSTGSVISDTRLPVAEPRETRSSLDLTIATTGTPRRAKSNAISRPIPRLEPIMNAVAAWPDTRTSSRGHPSPAAASGRR